METVLVVDDDEMFRAIMKRNLEKLGYSVAENNSGVGVLKQIQELNPIACLLDIVMDNKEGLETIGELNTLSIRPKIIAVSSNSFYLECAVDLGADAQLKKPVTTEALSAVLAEL